MLILLRSLATSDNSCASCAILNAYYQLLVSLTDSEEMITKTVHVLERNKLNSAEAIMSVSRKELLKCRNCGDVMADLILKIADILRKEKEEK